ncbi:ankyrin repeat and fibronectin type-III domain-containing protein 1-like [Amia ocellicauda]|uniref:ankyrin repeat and fibronectin type-III domain-containing protein 1-like n=1 Tax=Amia ocellicauda TaxID=2972642 RepID=UPI003463B386
MGEDSVLEMLSYSKFTDLETWLCMPSTVLPRSSDPPSGEMTPLLTQTEAADSEQRPRPLERKAPVLVKCQSLPIPTVPGSPSAESPRGPGQDSVIVRKRRRLPPNPGGLHWNTAGTRQREYDRAETLPAFAEKHNPNNGTHEHVLIWGISHKPALRKSISVDEHLFQPPHKEQHKLLSRLERGRNKLRNIHSLGSTSRYETRKKLARLEMIEGSAS